MVHYELSSRKNKDYEKDGKPPNMASSWIVKLKMTRVFLIGRDKRLCNTIWNKNMKKGDI